MNRRRGRLNLFKLLRSRVSYMSRPQDLVATASYLESSGRLWEANRCRQYHPNSPW